MMVEIKDLIANEIEIISRKMAEQVRPDYFHGFRCKAIATSLAWAEWSKEKSQELTFTTFAHEFNYQDDDIYLMFQAVNRILRAAHP